MSDQSSILSLPYLQPSQAQKHVTHNEALERLDVIVQLSVLQFSALIPPALPEEGDVYALGLGTTDAWGGQDARIAAYQGGVWRFYTPLEGWRAWGQAEQSLRVWNGSDWVVPETATDQLDGVGIQTNHDSTNRLSVVSQATLLSHDGAGHQLKINKASDADTASLLFQTGYSGRAEMGLAGNDDFSLKVSADGVSWSSALQIAAATGLLSGDAVQSGAFDATAGKLVRCFGAGVFGIGASGATEVCADLNDAAMLSGFYRVVNGATLGTAPAAASAGLIVIRTAATQLIQIWMREGANSGVHIRQYDGAVWSGWRRIYTADSIVGAVSQSGGIPTGAVIETGSNANGRYVRYADGTQICTKRITGVGPLNNGFGAIFRANDVGGGAYAAMFQSVPAVTLTATKEGMGYGGFWSGFSGPATTAGWPGCRIFAGLSNGDTDYVLNLTAIGRWF